MTAQTRYHRVTRSMITLAALAGLSGVAACGNIDEPNLGGASIEQLETTPTPSAIISASQSLLSTWRGTSNGHAQTLSKYGFEIWQIRASNPPSLTQVVTFPQTGGFWGYGGVKNIGVLLRAVDVTPGMTDAAKQGVRGWAKTILAVQYEDMAQAHDTFGIVLDLPADPLNDIPPIASKAEVWTRIFRLLDEADTHLAAAGGTFAFGFGPGYAGFNTPATFRQVNRALKARYKVHYAPPGVASDSNWAQALTLLSGTQTFINTAAAGLTRAGLQRGPFHSYTTTTGDATNGLQGTDYYLNTRIRDDAQLKAVAGARDDRVALKSRTVASFTFLEVTSNLKAADFLNTNLTTPTALGSTSPLPIIRNEELILLRAEANYNLGNLSAAIADINLIRVNSGGLPPITDPYVATPGLNQPATLLDELLYQKRYSLWGEIGSVWLDMRHYNKILEIPRYHPSYKLFDVFPIPQAECEVRGFSTRGCFQGGYVGK